MGWRPAEDSWPEKGRGLGRPVEAMRASGGDGQRMWIVPLDIGPGNGPSGWTVQGIDAETGEDVELDMSEVNFSRRQDGEEEAERAEHQPFSVGRTNLAPGGWAVHYQPAPVSNGDGSTTHYLRLPLLHVGPAFSGGEALARGVAQILNENAHRFCGADEGDEFSEGA